MPLPCAAVTRRLLECVAQCHPGAEAVTAAELSALGLRTGRPGRGVVPFLAPVRGLYAANLRSRTASRVLVRAARFHAATFSDLERGATTVEWASFLAPDTGAAFRVSSTRSRLYHTGAVAERLAAAVDATGPARQLVVVRVDHDVVTISIDASGDLLHRRGWRLDGGKAPLRETLAAALLAAAGWDARVALVDPLCGSGTIAVEAAQVARNLAPGWNRQFAFEHWPSFEPGTWASVRGEAAALVRPAAGVPVVASDRDEGAVAATRANAERAGVGDDVTTVSRRCRRR
jgi:putative N6-adenine-specific DNA methylase